MFEDEERMKDRKKDRERGRKKEREHTDNYVILKRNIKDQITWVLVLLKGDIFNKYSTYVRNAPFIYREIYALFENKTIPQFKNETILALINNTIFHQCYNNIL